MAGQGLSALLAGRGKEQKREPKTQQELRDAARHIWSRHQKLDELLLENGSSEHGKSILSSNLGRGGNKMSVPEQFIVTALKDEASVLGMPAGFLSARIAANLIEKISTESDQTTLLSAEHRKKLFCLFQSLKELLTYNAFCHSVFAQEMWKMQRPPILEVAWHLHRENIVRLEELLEKNLEAPTLVDWLSSSLCLLCHQMEEMDTEVGQDILTGKAGWLGKVQASEGLALALLSLSLRRLAELKSSAVA